MHPTDTHDDDHHHSHTQRPFARKDFLRLSGPLAPVGEWVNTTLNHLRDPNESHPLHWDYWHMVDIATDGVKELAKEGGKHLDSIADLSPMARQAAPAVKTVARYIPLVGVVAEGVHVMKPWQRAHHDFRAGQLSAADYARLCAGYTAYTLAGLGGFLTAGIKEAGTLAVLEEGWIEADYVPHSLTEELHHAGWVDENTVTTAKRWVGKAVGLFGLGRDHAGTPHHHTPGQQACEVCASELGNLSSSAAPAETPDHGHTHHHHHPKR